MPAKSKKQFKFFKYLENNPEEARRKGIKKSTVKDFTEGMTKGKWKKLKEKVSGK